MPDMIEPNVHPVFVHFTYALLTVSALSLFIVALQPQGGWRDTLKHAGDWMLFFGALAAIATVGAGFQAYYSVAHDGPSHAAMTMHRNWAVPTAVALLALAVWRYSKRSAKPGILFAALFLAAAGFLTITAWWGGRLVYHHGLGVMSMPQAEGPGHDHEHGPGEEHGPGTDEAAGLDGYDHDADPAAALAGEGAESHEHEPAPAASIAAAIAGDYPDSPAAVVEAFGAALKGGDAAMLEKLLAPDVLIAEGGGAERSFAEYQSHHMPADMEFTKAVETTIKDRRVFEGVDMTTVVTSAQTHGAFRGRTIHSRMMETMVLRRSGGAWRIAHIHWSSAEIEGDHEH